jgi:hypothetical protein
MEAVQPWRGGTPDRICGPTGRRSSERGGERSSEHSDAGSGGGATGAGELRDSDLLLLPSGVAASSCSSLGRRHPARGPPLLPSLRPSVCQPLLHDGTLGRRRAIVPTHDTKKILSSCSCCASMAACSADTARAQKPSCRVVLVPVEPVPHRARAGLGGPNGHGAARQQGTDR